MFEQENALPGSKLHFAVDNRDCLAGTRQSHADVRRHVIAAFRTVSKVISIFRHQTIEKFLQVMSRRGIGILHENDAATRVLNKHRDCPTAQAALIDFRLNLVGDFVGPFASSANVELILVNTHRILENNTGPHNSRVDSESFRELSRRAKSPRFVYEMGSNNLHVAGDYVGLIAELSG